MATLEPLSLSNKKYDEIAGRVRESFPNSCILWIEEVFNDELEKAHQDLFESIPGATKMELFHGTTEKAAISICNEGFKTEYNVTSAYGKGTYFAKNASYSIDYSKKNAIKTDIVYMLLCSVIVGKTVIGSQSVHNTTDTMVNNINAPTIFISPIDAGGIPKYMIAFHKNPTI